MRVYIPLLVIVSFLKAFKFVVAFVDSVVLIIIIEIFYYCFSNKKKKLYFSFEIFDKLIKFCLTFFKLAKI